MKIEKPVSPTDEQQRLIFEALGQVSMCWNPKPSSQVFDSTEAKRIGDELVAKLFSPSERKTSERVEGKPNILLDKLAVDTYAQITSFANYSEMNGISKGWIIGCIRKSFDALSSPSIKTMEEKQIGEMQPLLDLLALHGGRIVSTSVLDTNAIENARATGRMFVDNNSLGFVWEPDWYGGGKLFMMPQTEEEIEWFDKWFPVPNELPEKLKNPDFLFEDKRMDELLGVCKGAKCTIENCKVCKNEMY